MAEELFCGHFGRVKLRTDAQWGGNLREQDAIEKLLRGMAGQNYDYTLLVNLYVGEASRRFGAEQLNGDRPVEIKTELVKQTGFGFVEQGSPATELVYVDQRLHPVWQMHWKGLPSMLSMVQQMKEGRFVQTTFAMQEDVKKFFDRWPQGSAGHRQMIENLARFGEGLPSLQEETQEAADGRLSDAFFSERVYRILTTGGPIEGELIGPEFAGKTLAPRDTPAMALDKIEARAAERGIEPQGITRAMLEGRLSFDPRDLQLAFQGILDDRKGGLLSAYIEEQVRELGVSPTRDFQHQFSMTKEMFAERARAKAWNRRFGGVITAVGAESIFQGEPVTLTLEHLSDRLQDRR